MILVPVRTVSEANQRGHWSARARRAKGQREAARLMVLSAIRGATFSAGRFALTLTRIAPRHLDSDNLAAALKAVRDGVADALRLDDGDPRLTWEYAQAKGKKGEYAVLVLLSFTPENTKGG